MADFKKATEVPIVGGLSKMLSSRNCIAHMVGAQGVTSDVCGQQHATCGPQKDGQQSKLGNSKYSCAQACIVAQMRAGEKGKKK